MATYFFIHALSAWLWGLSIGFHGLSIFSFDVFVFQGYPLFDQEAMGVVIRAGNVS